MNTTMRSTGMAERMRLTVYFNTGYLPPFMGKFSAFGPAWYYREGRGGMTPPLPEMSGMV